MSWNIFNKPWRSTAAWLQGSLRNSDTFYNCWWRNIFIASQLGLHLKNGMIFTKVELRHQWWYSMCGATMIWLANPSLKESKSLAGFKGKSCEMSPLDCVQEICINLRVLRCGNNDDECQEKECSPSLKEDIISVIAKDELQEQVSNQNLLLSNCNQTVFLNTGGHF